ncbi:MarR family winged helix-turn-helix transcriptional regulator [Acidocella aminolytica]|uniref:MarR family winged helix-turn-helix transcriptional regulator n=1 Tax=Acidocella aminolytica TaxID=33998 RepID=UPI000662148C|nr:MarR family transcriptional regulator [Acidocella aminolytica]SHE29542.1 MarR family transcriptional regulator, transcriptional regulator for hemolysin [Acidocella aminolytica 101 = DSM 11237]
MPPKKKNRENFASMLGLATRTWRRAANSYLLPFKLTEATWLPLIHLLRATAPMRQKDLAFSMSLDGSSIVRLLDNLEKASLIRREEEASDRRAKLIVLTRKGRTLANQVRNIVDQVQIDSLSGLTDHEVEVAYKVLEHICAALNSINGEID